MNRITAIAVIAALSFIVSPHPLKAQRINDIDRLVSQVEREQGMQHGTLAVCVYNVATGKEVYGHNATHSLVPASVNKIFTTVAGFAQLGTDFRFTTRIAVRGATDRDGVLHGNIYIEGGGDPLLGSYRYRQTQPDSLFHGWMQAIKRKGIRRVDGRVCYNSNIFDDKPLHDSWQWGDVGNYYGAGVTGLNFHENMYFVYFNPGKRLGHPATVARTQPKNIDILNLCEVTTGPENSGDHVTIYGSPHGKERLYRGTVPLGKNDFAVRGALPNPAKTCADLFASYLRTQGISISAGSMQVLSTPDSLRPVLDYYSSPYYTIAQYTNLTSNNIYAESIFKYLGHKRYGSGTFENGSRAVMDYFKEHNLNTDGIRIVDGSGLSRQNHVTADFICRFLTAVSHDSFYNEFKHTLPHVGESGTARNMLPSLPKNISVRVKTGTMDEVKSYAGYITTASGETYAFSIISNGHDGTSKAVTDKMNKILLKIATSL